MAFLCYAKIKLNGFNNHFFTNISKRQAKNLNAWEWTIVSVHLKKANGRMKVATHILVALAKVIHGLMSECKVLQVKRKINWQNKEVPEVTWMSGSGIKISCIS